MSFPVSDIFEVQTPAFEFYDVFSNEDVCELIKFIDKKAETFLP